MKKSVESLQIVIPIVGWVCKNCKAMCRGSNVGKCPQCGEELNWEEQRNF